MIWHDTTQQGLIRWSCSWCWKRYSAPGRATTPPSAKKQTKHCQGSSGCSLKQCEQVKALPPQSADGSERLPYTETFDPGHHGCSGWLTLIPLLDRRDLPSMQEVRGSQKNIFPSGSSVWSGGSVENPEFCVDQSPLHCGGQFTIETHSVSDAIGNKKTYRFRSSKSDIFLILICRCLHCMV